MISRWQRRGRLLRSASILKYEGKGAWLSLLRTILLAFLLLFCAPESPRGLTQAEAAAEASHRVPEAGDANG